VKRTIVIFAIMLAAALAVSCGEKPLERVVLLASTIGPVESGVVDALENAFEKETGIRVRHAGAGTGATIEMAKKGGIDIVLVHAKKLEEEFVKDGYGTGRMSLMYNDFIIVGPESDPAKIKGTAKAADALRAIAASQSKFVTRGDKSGTHIAELALWEKAGLKPAGDWYETYEKGAEGNSSTLKYTDSKDAYTVIDRATWLALKKTLKIRLLVEKDEALLNYITIIPVNPDKVKGVYAEGAMKFAEWLTDPAKGQKIIQEFGKDKYGEPLFFPNSEKFKKGAK